MIFRSVLINQRQLEGYEADEDRTEVVVLSLVVMIILNKHNEHNCDNHCQQSAAQVACH